MTLTLFRRWHRAAPLHLPRLTDVLGADPQTTLANALMLVRLADDLLFVHHGAGAVQMMGQNFTGWRHSDLGMVNARAIEPHYRHALDAGEPVYFRFVSAMSTKHFSMELLVLPFAGNGGERADLLLVICAPLDDVANVLKAVFEHSQVGMIAAMPDGNAKAMSGRILMINPRARQLLKLPEAMGRLNAVSDIGPWFRDGAMWTRVSSRTEGRQTQIHYRDRATLADYRVTVEPIDRFVLFSIIEAPQFD